MFEIAAEDYQAERDLFEMWRWIDATMRRIWAREDCEEILFERQGKLVKQFLEEAVPVARLGLHLHHPGLGVSIACVLGNQPFDAVMRLEDPARIHEFKVEVTTVETPDAVMRRQALARNGCVDSWGPITKKGREIQSQGEFRTSDDINSERIRIALERARGKLEKEPPYEPGTAIVVHADWPTPTSLRDRWELVGETRAMLERKGADVLGIFYSYGCERAVDGVKARPR